MTEQLAWQRHLQHHDPEAREWLINHYLPLARATLERLNLPTPHPLEPEDLLSEAHIALIHAIDTYNPAHNTAPKTWIIRTIRTHIAETIRAHQPHTRNTHRILKQIENIQSLYILHAQLPPPEHTLLHQLNIPHYRKREILQSLALANPESLDAPLTNDPDPLTLADTLHDPTNPYQILEQRDLAQHLRRALMCLRPRLRQLITLLYYHELPSREVMRLLNISESRFRQLHAEAIRQLRTLTQSPIRVNTPKPRPSLNRTNRKRESNKSKTHPANPY